MEGDWSIDELLEACQSARAFPLERSTALILHALVGLLWVGRKAAAESLTEKSLRELEGSIGSGSEAEGLRRSWNELADCGPSDLRAIVAHERARHKAERLSVWKLHSPE